MKTITNSSIAELFEIKNAMGIMYCFHKTRFVLFKCKCVDTIVNSNIFFKIRIKKRFEKIKEPSKLWVKTVLLIFFKNRFKIFVI